MQGVLFLLHEKGKKNGSEGRTRTYDQPVNSRLLYHWATSEHYYLFTYCMKLTLYIYYYNNRQKIYKYFLKSFQKVGNILWLPNLYI